MGELSVVQKPYPLWGMTYKQQLVASVDGSKHVEEIYMVFVTLSSVIQDIVIYKTNSKLKAEMVLSRVQGTYVSTCICKWLIDESSRPAMINIFGQIYRVDDIYLDSCTMVYTQITDNENYGENNEGISDMLNFVLDMPIWYDPKTMLIHNDQIFIDGDLLYSKRELHNLCDKLDICSQNIENEIPKLVDYINRHQPKYEIRQVVCGNSTVYIG